MRTINPTTALTTRPRRALAALAATTLALSLAACSSPGTGTTSEPSASGTAAAAAFPVTVDNCGEELVIKSQPKKVMVLSTIPVGSIEAAGGLAQITEYSGKFSGDYFSDAVRKHFADIKPLTEKVIQADLTREAIVEAAPDLVVGYDAQSVSRASLAEVGIPMYVPPAWCPNAPKQVSFEDAYKDVTVFGTMLGHPDVAAASVDALRKRVAAVKPDVGDLKTAAFVWPNASGALNGYGTGSISTSQLEALGLKSVFGEQSGRAFEISMESLVEKNPDVLVVVYPEDSDPKDAIARLSKMPGADSLAAIKNGRVLTVQPALLDPAGAFSIVGLERLNAQLAKLAG